MRSMFFAAVAAVAVLAGCGIGAPDYPQFGETSYRIEGRTASADGGAATQTVIYRDGPRMRVEATLPNYGQATIVYDESTNAAYVLNPTTSAPTAAPAAGAPVQPAAPAPTAGTAPQQQTATTTPTTPPTTPAAPGTAPAPTAAPAQVLGVAVRIDDADAPQPLEAAWEALGSDNARSAGRCEVAGEDGHLWRPREAPAAGVERTACITDDGIVLRVTENELVLWEATSLQRGEQEASLFGVPRGYQLMDPEAVVEQVGENMQQLDSVTGAPQTPQQAPPPG